MSLPFGEWLPDQPDLDNAVTVAKNVVPAANGYRSTKTLTSVTNSLDMTCRGALWVRQSNGNFFYFAGDSSKLYKLTGTDTFGDVSKSGGYAITDDWNFAKWGDRIIACNLGAATQYYDMGSSSLFADLPGSPPRGRFITNVRDFLVMGDLSESGSLKPDRVRWSGFNNSEEWTSSLSTQSDFQDLQGLGGPIMGIVGGETGLIFQRDAIRRMTYTGPPTIFRFDYVERDRGCAGRNSIAVSGESVYFLSHDGFYVKHGDQLSQPIGSEKVDEYFFADYTGGDFSDVHGAIDRRTKTVFWSFPSTEASANRILAYRWDLGKWSLIDQDAKIMVEHAAPSYDLDSLDGILADIDSASIPVESTLYQGGGMSIGAFMADDSLGTFTGAVLAGTVETGEFKLPNGKRASVKNIRPLIDGTSTIAVGTRANQTDSYAYGSAITLNSNGEADALSSSRFHRFKAVTSGAFTEATGVEVFYREEGRR